MELYEKKGFEIQDRYHASHMLLSRILCRFLSLPQWNCATVDIVNLKSLPRFKIKYFEFLLDLLSFA